MSLAAFMAKYPSGQVTKRSIDYGKVFVCRRGCNTRTATYTEEFVWEDIYHGVDDLDDLENLVKTYTKATRKRKKQDVHKDQFFNVCELNQVKTMSNREQYSLLAVMKIMKYPKPQAKDARFILCPRRCRRLGRRYARHECTPHPRIKGLAPEKRHITNLIRSRIIIKKTLEFTPLGTRILSPTYITSSPFQVARSRLHVSAVPTALPCREEAFATVYSHLEAAITDGSGCCIYISGTPGTGKTATVREVVAQLDAAAIAEELDDFIFVEINGMKVTDPHQSYSLLWEALRGDRVSPSHALDLLEREFSNPNPRRVPCVVLMDELDQLVTKNQSVMYNFFNWPSLRHSRLIVLAVANTMDLPERTLSNKISSRLGQYSCELLDIKPPN